jgi:succinate dehydrogenase / fumarate reductase cytochrome b subunit
MSSSQENKKNAHNNHRPLSPHLTIYKPQISSVMSILHRITGVFLFFSLALFAWWFILLVFNKFDSKYLDLSNLIIFKLAAFFTTAGFFYHLCNGIRHLLWDYGKCLSVHQMRFTGLFVLASTCLLQIIFWIVVV